MEQFSGDELLILIEALDAFIPPQGSASPAWGSQPPWSEADRQRFEPFALLRHRLACAVGMGYYDSGRKFLSDALHHERYALTDALHGRMSDLLKQEGLTRRQLRAGMIAAFQELREVRYYQVKMPFLPLPDAGAG